MKRLIAIAALLCLSIVSFAQEKPKPEIVRLEAPAQQELSEAQRAANDAKLAMDAATARYEAAQQKIISTIFRTMANAGLKPKEWAIRQDQSGIYFEKVKPAETTAAKPQRE